MSKAELARNEQFVKEYDSIGGGEARMYEISYDRKNPSEIIKQL